MMKVFLPIWFFLMGFSTLCYAYRPSHSNVGERVIIPQGMHSLLGKAIDGSFIEIENGAQFRITRQEDRNEVLRWSTDSVLRISPNPYWWMRNASFVVTHYHSGNYVFVNEKAGPVLDHPLTYIICDINPYQGKITIGNARGDSTCWKIDRQDIPYTQDWKVGESIIIGHYDVWYSRFFSGDKYILISYENIDQVKFVRATPF